jgi:DNA repair ATPase RecN
MTKCEFYKKYNTLLNSVLSALNQHKEENIEDLEECELEIGKLTNQIKEIEEQIIKYCGGEEPNRDSVKEYLAPTKTKEIELSN